MYIYLCVCARARWQRESLMAKSFSASGASVLIHLLQEVMEEVMAKEI